MEFSGKQWEIINDLRFGNFRRINLLEGSVRSGKTFISLVIWCLIVLRSPKNSTLLMTGKTLTTLKRNVLVPLAELIGTRNFVGSAESKEGTIFGRKVYFEGAADESAESKIRGMTLYAAYCDELTLFPESFFAMMLSRLSMDNAMLLATTNPDLPNHWLMKNYIERSRQGELEIYIKKLTIDDNPFLPADYVSELKKEYTGVFYRRFILGEWCAAEGAVYADFAEDPEKFLLDDVKLSDIIEAYVGVDFGGNGSAHAFVLTGVTRRFEKVITLDEYYRREMISPVQLENDFVDFIGRNVGKYRICDVYCDSAEQTLIRGLRNAAERARLPIEIHNAKKGAISERIRLYNMMLARGQFFILRKCVHTIEAFRSAVWDGSSGKRLDNGSTNIDSLDAQEYSTEHIAYDLTNIRRSGTI